MFLDHVKEVIVGGNGDEVVEVLAGELILDEEWG